MTEIISLGCGGGRHQTVDQSFKTGGFRIHSGNTKFHVDPGPGALLLSGQLGLDPLKLDGLVVSHSHTDHSTDAEVLVEAIEKGNSSDGVFVGNKSAVEGGEDLAPGLSEFHRRKVGELVLLEPSETYDYGDFRFEATPAQHSDPEAIGVKFHTSSGIVGYTGDTQKFEGISEAYEDVRVLIANVTRPDEKRIDWHLCSEDLVEILKDVDPEVAMILHMGMLFLRNPPTEEARRIQERTGVKTVPGFVGTRVVLDGEAKIERRRKQLEIDKFS